MTSKADQGKTAESAVQKYLEAYHRKVLAFDWSRNYDAKSAGGRFQRQTGDFQFFLPGIHGVIEVKEVKHDYRLPHGNYDEPKVAKCYKRSLAGGIIVVLVNHTTTGLWRMPPFSFIRKREGGSWDLREFKTFESAAEAFDILGIFI
jgi:hypothetical protein